MYELLSRVQASGGGEIVGFGDYLKYDIVIFYKTIKFSFVDYVGIIESELNVPSVKFCSINIIYHGTKMCYIL